MNLSGTVYAASATFSVTGNAAFDSYGSAQGVFGAGALVCSDLNVTGNGVVNVNVAISPNGDGSLPICCRDSPGGGNGAAPAGNACNNQASNADRDAYFAGLGSTPRALPGNTLCFKTVHRPDGTSDAGDYWLALLLL